MSSARPVPLAAASDSHLFDPSGNSADAIHDGLYVVDVSVIPGAIGVNSTLTIVTQAIHSMENALVEMGEVTSAIAFDAADASSWWYTIRYRKPRNPVKTV